MKQHIDIKQLRELSIQQLNSLVVFLEMDKYYREARWKTLIYEEDVLNDLAIYCNIGNMIESLCNSDFCFPTIGLTESKKVHELIVVGVSCLSGSKEYRGKTFEGDDLCDALWNAIKAIIK